MEIEDIILKLQSLMRELYSPEEVVDILTPQWIGKKNVVGIAVKEDDEGEYIVFYVIPPFKRSDFPDEVYGYRIKVEPSGEIVAF